jgi:hypothetical protein
MALTLVRKVLHEYTGAKHLLTATADAPCPWLKKQ